jgi:dipeptidyl aminopeptidase/acylaminoacyl peptidase
MKQLWIAAVLLFCSSLYSQDRVAAAIDSLPEVKTIDQVAISPDGAQVAYIVAGELSVASIANGEAHRVASSQNATREVTWSADSHYIAWLNDLPGDKPASQLWSASADGSDLTQRATFEGYAQTPRYSPDGKTISILYIEGMPRVAGPLQPMTPLAGVVGSKIYEQRVTTIDLATNKLTQVSPADVYVYEYDWLPDSSGWIATTARGSGDNNWWIARLYAIDVRTGDMREIYKPKWQIAEPHVSPDGKAVALIEGLMSDEGLTGGDVMLVPVSGGAARNLTPQIHASPSSLSWNSNDRISVVANSDGKSAYMVLNTAGLKPGAHWDGWAGEEVIGTQTEVWVPSASFSRDGAASAVVRQSPTSPPEVWAGPSGAWMQITHLNEGVHSPRAETRNVHWMSDGHEVQGWLTFPKDYDPAKKYPLVLTIHGGPSWACLANWGTTPMGDMRAASLLGWFVLCPNPRGSFGQGEAFTQGNIKDFGGRDYRDLMEGVDAMIKRFPIDRHKSAFVATATVAT